METQVCVLYASQEPAAGVVNPKPNQIYKNMSVKIEKRKLDNLAPDQVRVKMLYVSLCGTDIHLTQENKETGYMINSAPTIVSDDGRVIGHEGVGLVLEVGTNVKHIHKNDYVTFESIVSCKVCNVCRKGNFNQCVNSKLLGLEIDGLFGTIVDVPAILTHNISDMIQNDADLKAAACIEPASVAYVACENTRITAGDVVVIFGAGPIGIFSAMLARKVFGAASIYIVEPVEFRRRLAKKWCEHVCTEEEFYQNRPDSIDVVLETSGNLEHINKVFTHCGPNARIALLARKGESLKVDSVDHLITNSISLVGSRGHLGGAFEKIIKLHHSGRIDLNEVVTSVFNGVEEIKNCLEVNHEKVLMDNCKVLFKI